MHNTSKQIHLYKYQYEEQAPSSHTSYANFSCFQRSVIYAGIRIFNSLPLNPTNLRDEKAKFKVALRRHSSVHSFYLVDKFFLFMDDS